MCESTAKCHKSQRCALVLYAMSAFQNAKATFMSQLHMRFKSVYNDPLSFTSVSPTSQSLIFFGFPFGY